jgi:hypothetical protein
VIPGEQSLVRHFDFFPFTQEGSSNLGIAHQRTRVTVSGGYKLRFDKLSKETLELSFIEMIFLHEAGVVQHPHHISTDYNAFFFRFSIFRPQ